MAVTAMQGTRSASPKQPTEPLQLFLPFPFAFAVISLVPPPPHVRAVVCAPICVCLAHSPLLCLQSVGPGQNLLDIIARLIYYCVTVRLPNNPFPDPSSTTRLAAFTRPLSFIAKNSGGQERGNQCCIGQKAGQLLCNDAGVHRDGAAKSRRQSSERTRRRHH